MLRTRALLRLLAASIVLGCATNKPFDRTTEPGGRPLSQTTAGSVILTGEDLSANPGWTVLDAIRRAMPQVKISTGRGLNPCPLIELRGKDSVTGSSDPEPTASGTRRATRTTRRTGCSIRSSTSGSPGSTSASLMTASTAS